MASTPPTPDDLGQVPPDDDSIPTRRGRIGRIVAGSLATGIVAALLLVVAPLMPVQENDITGAVLWGFALGWAMLALLSGRFTDEPQRWAAVPAVFMGVSGLLLVAAGSGVNDALHWVWPPTTETARHQVELYHDLQSGAATRTHLESGRQLGTGRVRRRRPHEWSGLTPLHCDRARLVRCIPSGRPSIALSPVSGRRRLHSGASGPRFRLSCRVKFRDHPLESI